MADPPHYLLEWRLETAHPNIGKMLADLNYPSANALVGKQTVSCNDFGQSEKHFPAGKDIERDFGGVRRADQARLGTGE